MTTTCFLQSSVVSTSLRFPPSIAKLRHNLWPTSPVLIHHLNIHHFSCCRNHQHLIVSSDVNTLTRTCDSEKYDFSRNYVASSTSEVVSNNEEDVDLQDEIGDMRILMLSNSVFRTVKKGFEKFMLHHFIAQADPNVPLSAELNKDKNLIQMFEQRDPGHEISGKAHSTTTEANRILKFHLNTSNLVMMAALTVCVTVLLVDEKATALGPEGPLMEEFWENMRRYALYALTVSSGVAYAVFQPLYELLRNPISAILVITIAVGSFYLVSQVLSAMVGVSDFNYEYSY